MRASADIGTIPRFIEALDYLPTRGDTACRNLPAMLAAAEAYDQTCKYGIPLAMSRANKDFHMAIARAGGNLYLANAYARQRDTDDPFPLGPEHYQMIEAIREKDEAEADSLAHAHTRVFHQRLQDFMAVEFISP